MKRKSYVVTIPDSPKSVNQGGGGVRRTHWAPALKEKHRWQDTFADSFMFEAIPKGMLFCGVDVTLRFKGRHHRDVENYRHPVIKPLADALVSGGWLTDDTEEWFKVEGFHLEEGVELSIDALHKSEIIVKLEACYAH